MYNTYIIYSQKLDKFYIGYTSDLQNRIEFEAIWFITTFNLLLQKMLIMELPKFLLADNTDFVEDIFIIHLDFPRFIVNLKNDELELLDETDELSDAELQIEIDKLLLEATEFYDREISRYDS